MNFSKIFSVAHSKTRAVMAAYGLNSYRAAFGVCLSLELKKAWILKRAIEKKAANDNVISDDQKAVNFGNNESASTGIFPQQDGSFLVLTSSKSFTYKTRRGAEKKWAQIMASKQASLL